MRIWQRAASTPWAITEDALRNIQQIAERQNRNPEAVATEMGRELENTHAVEFRDGIAILSVSGPLFRYANLFTRISGATSYELLAQDFQQAVDDEQVSAILLDIDSPGGEVNGNAEFADLIYQARGTKPIVAYVGGVGASAAYWIASAADEVVAHETALVGSVGTVTKLVDDSEQKRENGIREYVIASSQSPNKHIDPANEDDRSRVQQTLDDLAAVFVAKVARNRGVSEATVLSDFGQGDMLVGKKAVEAGLADRLGSFESLVAELAPSQQPSTQSPGVPGLTPAASGPTATEDAMTIWLTDKAPAAGEEQRHYEATAANLRQYCPDAVAAIESEVKQSAQAEGGQSAEQAAEAERQRMSAILGLEEAKGREAQAQALATTPGMTADNAKAVLAQAPQSGSAGFFASMEDPNVGPDGPGAGEEQDPHQFAASLVAQARESGVVR